MVLSKQQKNIREWEKEGNSLMLNEFYNSFFSEESRYSFERNILVEHWHERIKPLVRAVLKNENPPMPLFEIEIQPESHCNVSCKHCIGRFRRPKLRESISNQTMVQIIEDIISFNQKKPKKRIKRIRFLGAYGEPLMNPATLIGVKKAIEGGIEVGLFTNGLLLDEKARNILVNANYVHVSLDAGSETSLVAIKGVGGFENILNNIKSLSSLREKIGSNLSITVGYIIHHENYSEIYELVKKLKSIGVNTVRFKMNLLPSEDQWLTQNEINEAFVQIKRSEDGLADENFEIIAIHSKKETSERVPPPNSRRCFYAYLMGAISSDSSVCICDHSAGYPLQDIRIFGVIGRREKGKGFFEVLEEGRNRLANIVPSKVCHLCPPAGQRVNSCLEFLCQAEEKEPGFLDLVEEKYINPLKKS